MEMVYLLNGSESGGGGGSGTVVPARYRIIDKEGEEGAVQLTDRCVTRITLESSEQVKIVLPPLQEG